MFLKKVPLLERMQACMIAGALGDSFGAPVEMLTNEEIVSKYGTSGITKQEANPETGLYEITDDTQLSLFSLEALVLDKNPETLERTIFESYLRWFDTQFGPGTIPEKIARVGILHKTHGLYSMRNPGHACFDSLRKSAETGIIGTIDNPINNSKGNGCLMRSAPLGFLVNWQPQDVYDFSLSAAAITHGDSASQQCAAVFSLIIYYLLQGKYFPEALALIDDFFWQRQGKKKNPAQIAIDRGIFAATRGKHRNEYFSKLGEGWIAEEALSLVCYFAAYTGNSLKTHLIKIVNSVKDRDTIASLFGNIYGTMYGFSYIDLDYGNLEFRNTILSLVNDFYSSSISPT